MIVRKNEAKTQEENVETTELTVIDVNPLLDTGDNVDSIWDKDQFPNNTNKITFTPKQLKNALIAFSRDITPIAEVLEQHKVNRNTFYELVRAYPEICDVYERARKLKADKYGEAMQATWKDLPKEPEMYVIDRDGNKSLSTAATQFLRHRSEVYNRMAQVCETGSYVPVTKQENTNRNLNLGVQLNGKLPDNFDLNSAGSDELINALKGKKKV